MTLDRPDLDTAKAVADLIRDAHPDMASGLDAMIAKAIAENATTVPIKVDIAFTLEKFEGERLVETIKGEG